MATNKLRIVFMGTPSFALSALEKLWDESHQPIAVYTQPDRINGRGKKIIFSPVKSFALDHNIPVFQPTSFKNTEETERIKALRPDLLVVIAYGRILPKDILELSTYGAINVHASLLPEYRGAAPIQRAIIDEKKETGITIMKLDVGMDTGDILIQKKVPIGLHMTSGELFESLSKEGADLLIKVLDNLPDYLNHATPQVEEQATYAEKVTKPMGKIDWGKEAHILDALIRGLYPNPGTFAFFRGKRIKLHKVEYIENGLTQAEPGTIVSLENHAIFVQTGEGLLKILEIQPENNKKMKSADFINGYQVKINDQLE